MPDYIYMDIGFDCNLFFVQEHKGHDGAIRHSYYSVNRAKGFNFVEIEDINTINGGILFSCDRKATAAIKDFIEMQRLMMPVEDQEISHCGPYYFTMDMSRESPFESKNAGVRLFGGPQTAYAHIFADEEYKAPSLLSRIFGRFSSERDEFMFNPEEIPMARYNCWTATQGLVTHVAGIDLGRIDHEFPEAYRAARATAILSKIHSSAREVDLKSRPWNMSSLRVLHQEDTPPVLLLSVNVSVAELLALKIQKKNETIAKFFSRYPVFEGRRIEQTPVPAPVFS